MRAGAVLSERRFHGQPERLAILTQRQTFEREVAAWPLGLAGRLAQLGRQRPLTLPAPVRARLQQLRAESACEVALAAPDQGLPSRQHAQGFRVGRRDAGQGLAAAGIGGLGGAEQRPRIVQPDLMQAAGVVVDTGRVKARRPMG